MIERGSGNGGLLIVVAMIIAFVIGTEACSLLTLEPDFDRPVECGTTEVGQAYDQNDSLVTATKVWICRETNVGWESTWCWFEPDNDMPLDHLRLTCETWHGWHRGDLPGGDRPDTTEHDDGVG